MKDCLELPPTNFSIFTLKNATWRTYLISFKVQYCFLFRFVCIELVSLIWFLQIWVAIYLYGTMILVHFDKEINADVYRHSLWQYSKRFHCSFEWHMTPHMTLSIETCIRPTPCIKQTWKPKKYLKWSFLFLSTCIKFHHPTCQTLEMRKIASNCHPQIFRFLR